MPDVTLIQDKIDTDMCRVYGRHPKFGATYLISIIHIDMVIVLFGEGIANYWFEGNPREKQIDIVVSAIPEEEEEE